MFPTRRGCSSAVLCQIAPIVLASCAGPPAATPRQPEPAAATDPRSVRTDEPAPPARQPDILANAPLTLDEPAAAESWRPDWWHDGMLREPGSVSACAFADAPDLADARAAALEAARRAIDPAALGDASPPAADRIDALALPGGAYRVFVRLVARG